MLGSLAAADVNFLPLQMAVFCAQCELISENNTPRCLACGSLAVLSLSRVLGGSLRGQQTAHLIEDAELDRLVRSLLHTVRHPAADDRYSSGGGFPPFGGTTSAERRRQDRCPNHLGLRFSAMSLPEPRLSSARR